MSYMKQIFEICEESQTAKMFEKHFREFITKNQIVFEDKHIHEYAVELWTDYTAGYL